MSPHASLAAFWLLYMAGMGMIFPFLSLYLRENGGLGGAELGVVLAIRPLVGMVGQPLWGHLADRSGSRARVLATVTLGAALAYAVFPRAEGFAGLSLAMFFVAVFATSVIPMSASVTLAALGTERASDFGRVRVFGTVGFLLLVVGFPPALHVYQRGAGLAAAPGGPSEPGLELMFFVASALTVAASVLAFRQHGRGLPSPRSRRGDLRLLLRHGPFRRALVFAFLAWGLLQGPMLLFPVFIRESGGDLDTVSRMWIPMIALEIPFVLYSGAALRRLGPRALVAMGVIADGLRWTVCALAGDLRLVFAVQLLHGVVVAGLMVGLQLYVEGVVPERLRSTGQGVLAMVGPSVGGMLSAIGGGLLLEHFGARAPNAVAGVGALVLGVLTFALLPSPRRA